LANLVSMRISVIIPVYNAEQFLAAAIDSVLAQEEVCEIILVEDGSFDSSLRICTEYTNQHPRIRLLRHDDGANLGAGATRNLGLHHVTEPYIAFLDADDLYLTGRFSGTKQTFDTFTDADGVYETIGVKYYDDDLKEKHILRAHGENTGLRKEVSPHDLFRSLATGKFGHIHLDGLVLMKEALDASLLFDVTLKQCQDSDFMFRLANKCIVYPGDLSRTVALRGVHRNNRVFNQKEARHYRKLYLRKCIRHRFYGSMDVIANLYIVTRYIGASRVFQPFKSLGRFSLFFKSLFIGVFLLTHPGVVVNLMECAIKGRPGPQVSTTTLT